jgi:hypothetical protein
MFFLFGGKAFRMEKNSENISLAQGELQLLLTPSRTDSPLPRTVCVLYLRTSVQTRNSVFAKIHLCILSKITC